MKGMLGRPSNYDVTRELMEKEFPKYDPLRMAQRYGLTYDGEYVYVNFVGRPYRISRQTGKAQWSFDGFLTCTDAGYSDAMTLYDVLCKDDYTFALKGEYVSLRQLPGAAHAGSLGNNFHSAWAQKFAGKAEELDAACRALGGAKTKVGDVAYELKIFDFFPVVLQFWDADEEFDAQMNFLWDANTISFMHYETTYYAVGCLVDRLSELAGLPQSEKR